MNGFRAVGASEADRAFIERFLDASDSIEAMTSGSTGQPKLIRLLKNDMRLSARATNAFFGIDSTSVMAMPLSVDYIAGKMMIVRALEARCTLLCESPSMSPLSDCTRDDVDLVPIVPAQIGGFISGGGCKRCRHVIVGGGAVSAGQEEALCATGVKAYATYGMTETCSHVALRRMGTGEPFELLDGFTASTDPEGRLVIESSNMSFGRLHTNDVVHMLTPRSFVVLGRADNVIISGGEKIHPEADERLIASVLEGRKFYLTGRKSDLWGEEPVLVVEGTLGEEERQRLMDACRERLPRHHVPKDVIEVPSVRLTRTGKIIRDKIC